MMPQILNSDFALPSAAVLSQLGQNVPPGAPGWVLTALFGAFITLWFLREIGKLPGQKASNDLSDLDSERIEKLYYLLAQRNDDGIERFLKLAQEQREGRDIQKQILAELKKITKAIKNGS